MCRKPRSPVVGVRILHPHPMAPRLVESRIHSYSSSLLAVILYHEALCGVRCCSMRAAECAASRVIVLLAEVNVLCGRSPQPPWLCWTAARLEDAMRCMMALFETHSTDLTTEPSLACTRGQGR